MKIHEKYYFKKWRRLLSWVLIVFAFIPVALGALGIYLDITRDPENFRMVSVWLFTGGLVTSGLFFPLLLEKTIFIGLGPDGFVLN